MSVAPNSGIIDFSTFTPPSGGQDGIQGQVPKPLAGQGGYVLTANGWSSLGALGILSYQGTWDAATNTPTIVSGVGVQGYYYVVSVAGTTTIDGISNWGVGDWIIFNGSTWQKIEGGSQGNFTTLDVTGLSTLNEVYANIVRINQPWDEGTGRLQVSGQAAIEGNAVAQDVVVQGGNNLFQRSQEFENAAWTTTNSSVTQNAETAPDGTNTADKLIENTATGTHLVLQFVTASSSTTYNFSIYAKKGERTWIQLLDNGGSSANAYFDLNNGTLGSFANATALITNVGNGWYRCSISFTLTPSQTAANLHIRLATANNTNSYTGDGTSGLFIWGAQVERGTVASPYTPTTSAAVTTTNDVFVPSGQVLTGLGTASLPSYSALGDTNTGMFFPAADTIAFAEGGAEAMRIDSSGSLLVGDSSLTFARLNVLGQSNKFILHLRQGQNNTDGGIFLGNSENGTSFRMWLDSGVNPNLNFDRGGTSRFVLTSGGQLAASSDGTAAAPVLSRSSDLNTGLFFPAADTLAISTGGSERVRVTDTGNFLVGTSTKSSSNSIIQVLASTGSSGIQLSRTSSTIGGVAFITNGENLDIFTHTGTVGSEAFTLRLQIRSSGALVIGNGETAASPNNALLQATGGSGTNITGATLTIQGGRGTGSAAGGPIVFSTSAAGSSGTTLNAATERARIPAAGGFQCVNSISVGNATPSSTGAGITFPATQSASSDANTLDDYEEGTWTPVVADSASGGNVASAYTRQVGWYVKIGNRVFVAWRLEGIDTTGMTGANICVIRNLPFAMLNDGVPTTNQVFAGAASVANIAIDNSISTFVNSNFLDTGFRLGTSTSAGVSRNIIVSNLNSTTASIFGQFWYFV